MHYLFYILMNQVCIEVKKAKHLLKQLYDSKISRSGSCYLLNTIEESFRQDTL